MKNVSSVKFEQGKLFSLLLFYAVFKSLEASPLSAFLVEGYLLNRHCR